MNPLTVPDLLAVRAAEDPDAVAWIAAGAETLSFGDWLARAQHTASGLATRGVRRGERVALVFDGVDWPQYAIAFCGVHLAGAVAIPLAAGKPDGALFDVLTIGRAVAVVHGSSSPPPVRRPERVRWVADAGALSADACAVAGELPAPPGPDDLAQILFTSGTTARPKGVAASHANLTAGFVARPAQRPFAHSRHALHAFPIGTNAGQTMLLNALLARPAVVSLARFDAEQWCDVAQRLRVGSLFLVPAMAIELLRSGAPARADLSAVRLIGCTGAALPGAVAAELAAAVPSATLVNSYTSTEAAPAQTTMVYDPDRPGAVGRPTRPGDIMIRADDGGPAEPGQTGTVWLRSPVAPRHYADDPDASAAVFAGDWVRMGDVGYLDADGYLHLVDRESDVIVTGAHKVSSLRVEDALHAHPNVVAAAVVPVAHPVMGSLVGAVIVTRTPLDHGQLRQFLGGRLARYEIPAHIAETPTLPRNDGGKVRKRDLAGLLRPAAPSPAAATTSTPTEEHLATIWRAVLRTEAGDDFFALGGDSLRATQIAAAVGDHWGITAGVDDIFARPSIRALAAWIDERSGTVRPRGRETAAGARAPVTALQRVWLAEREADPPRSVVPIHVAIRIDEPIDLALFEDCLARLAERHEALHTPAGPATSTERRRTGGPTEALHAAAEFVIAAVAPPVRALTIDEADDRRLFVLSVDHLGCDGWSMGILLRELGLLYSAARTAPGTDPLPPVASTAAAAARWAEDRWPDHRPFWDKILASPVADPGPLPGQDVKPGSFDGASHVFTVPAGPWRKVAAAGRTTLMRVTLTAWASALREQTGSPELAFMTPLTGRARPEWEQVVGCLIQQPVVRVPLGDDPGPEALLARVHDLMAAATEHQFYPLHEYTGRVPHPAYFFYEPWARPAHIPGLASHQVALPPELGLRWPLPSGQATLGPPRLRLVERAGDVLEAQIVYNRNAVDAVAVRALAHRFLSALP
ncbi:non-ribosomal peptide synthetase [Dactylosporangium sp. NPDC049140]|uniref:class I adenylate-forming enzyme family protein n=1 Tax=Dactylosporangium sp. NPDC049140 TaxID=3155647 RepID=UPI0033FA189E